MRLACDTGGTFTDLIVEHDDGRLQMFKAATTPHDPIQGVIDATALAARDHGKPLSNFLSEVQTFIHGTTHAINAIITGRTARTALITTKGHPDILLLREGGRRDPFNLTAFPEPYIPRSLTYEAPERIGSAGEVIEPLDEKAVVDSIVDMRSRGAEAVAVCLLWSIANSKHEKRIGELLDRHLPGIPYTLSHILNPALREYRRASSTAIDASLKPLMTSYLGSLSGRLAEAGFAGRLLVLTSQGGMVDAADLAQAPIHAINSGPSLAPIAGKYYGRGQGTPADIVVADTGGTTYDVSLVRGDVVPLTRETWIGLPFQGHMTGFPSVDVKSIGAGGGSIAYVDDGGVLHVGPKSAGAAPGPVCYGRGGHEPTLTDACLVLGYLDPDYFLGGNVKLDLAAAQGAIEEKIARKLGRTVKDAAAAVVSVATENMVQAIADITVNQGIDPANAVLVGGGGAAGFNSVFIARRLNIKTVMVPEVGAALSAAGALISELSADYRATAFLTTRDFDAEKVNATLATLKRQGIEFLDKAGAAPSERSIEYSVEARYEHQVWELDVSLPVQKFNSAADVDKLVEAFHKAHERIFSFRDPESAVELVGWSVRARCLRPDRPPGRLEAPRHIQARRPSRDVYFEGTGAVRTPVLNFDQLETDQILDGPAIVESPFTTVVIDQASQFRRNRDGTLVIDI